MHMNKLFGQWAFIVVMWLLIVYASVHYWAN